MTETPASTPTSTPQELVDRARQIASAAHENQVDRSGAAYITHPERVAQRVAGHPEAEMVAWLHDVVEDTPITLDDLAVEFPAQVVAAVDAISRRDGEGDVYYHRVAADPLALKVKYADLDDNSSPHRLARLDPATQERLRAKYGHAREVLSEVAPRSAPPSR